MLAAPCMTWAATRSARAIGRYRFRPHRRRICSPQKNFQFEVTLDPVLCTYVTEARCQNLIMLRAALKG